MPDTQRNPQAGTTPTTSAKTLESPGIRQPSTIIDDGSPSDSCLVDSERVLRLIEDERHLCAQALLHSIQRRLYDDEIESGPATSPANDSSGTTKRKLRLRPLQSFRQQQQLDQQNQQKAQQRAACQKDQDEARQLLESNRGILNRLVDRCQLFLKAKQNLDVDDDWTLAQTLFGVTTYYRREEDGSLSIKLEGTIDGVSLFDQVAVLREIDLHYRWAPFCSSSLTVAHLDKLDTVGWFVVGLPHLGLMRDGCFRAIGCDSIYEDGSVLLVAQGIADKPEAGAERKLLEADEPTDETTTDGTTKNRTDDIPKDAEANLSEEQRIMELLSNDPVLECLDIPLPPTRMGSGRMTIKTFQAMIHIDSPTTATSKIVANIDPNLPLVPQSLLDFLMKRLCGVLLSKLQHAAKKISKDPVTNHHAIKMREEEDFYKRWLMEKFRDICKLRGWEEPKFSVFDLSDAQLDLAGAYTAKKKRRTQKTIKLYHSMTDDNLEDFFETNPRGGLDAATEPANIGHLGDGDNSGPRVRAISDGDSLSELSRNSSSTNSFWRGNPISSYLREVEERTELRKAKKIEESRQRATNRLKPKQLDHESRSRLDELRVARSRRDSQATPGMVMDAATAAASKSLIDANAGSKISSVEESPQPRARSSRGWALFLTKNGLFTRILVLSSLLGILFYLLFMGTAFEEFAFQEGSFLVRRGRDAATLLYLALAGIVHFFLSYVALMYSFSSLQIGRIAGNQAKRFYSHNVHLLLCVASGGMVALGVLKASFVMALEWMIWHSIMLWRAMASIFSLDAASSFLNTVMDPSRATGRVVSTLLARINFALLESNVVGRAISSSIGSLWSYKMQFVASLNSFVADTVNQYELDSSVPFNSWREDAFLTTRALLAYSAIFLLVLLFLFNLSARHAYASEQSKNEHGEGKSSIKQPFTSDGIDGEASSPSSNQKQDSNTARRLRAVSSSLSNFETINEEEDVIESPPSISAGQKAIVNGSVSKDSKGRLTKLRFRKEGLSAGEDKLAHQSASSM